ncbi:hypothetical protein DICSQDRAFT_151905 [Dichomitus squalens LYAD-421 SS1]|nr:uncharacterized protein DICSQDRAFT_151905 [Dichomitus squalens LYAD-421 SS1]EJF65858.1 hypothetical protein DICSQDRAFT_151905 [Dichomitus squalens LYAD-421 SS1]
MPLSVKGYTAHICCDGKELEQYDVQQEDERTVTCWIPSEAGKAFSVHWGDPSSTTMQVIVSVDGRVVLRRGQEGKRTGVFSKLTDRPGRIRAVEFSHLVLTDDETVASASSTSLQKLGVIEVEMRKVKSFCEGEDYYSVGEVLEIGPVHEKSKKAGAHAGSLVPLPCLRQICAQRPVVTCKAREAN